MISKTFDNHGNTRKLHIESASRGFVLLKIEFGGHEEYFTVSNDIVPSISLALLESAGYDPSEESKGEAYACFANATHYIRSGLEIQEREATEAKEQSKMEAEALDYWKAFHNATNQGIADDVRWSDLMPETQTKWLAVARKAREVSGKVEK